MAAQKSKSLIGLCGLIGPILATAPLQASEAIDIKLDNHLAACIKLGKPTTITLHGILFAKIPFVPQRTLATCGCKSALGTYTAYGKMPDYQSFLMKGNLVLNKAGTLTLPLALDQSLLPGKAVALVFSCAEPD